jgi:actin-related protein 5
MSRIARSEGERSAILDELEGAAGRGDKAGMASAYLICSRQRCFSYTTSWSQSTLQSEGFSDDAALDQAIKKLEADLKKTRKKAANDGDDATVSTPVPHF